MEILPSSAHFATLLLISFLRSCTAKSRALPDKICSGARTATPCPLHLCIWICISLPDMYASVCEHCVSHAVCTAKVTVVAVCSGWVSDTDSRTHRRQSRNIDTNKVAVVVGCGTNIRRHYSFLDKLHCRLVVRLHDEHGWVRRRYARESL